MSIPGYKTRAELYSGPGSQVLRAVREVDGRAVILKVLRPEYPSPEKIAWFKREHDSLCALDVAGVARPVELWSDASRYALVLEDAGGESLDRLIQTASWSILERLEIAQAIALTVGRVHESGVIHKDLNPSNVVFNAKTSDIEIIDFGISTVLSRQSPSLRSATELEGTLAYISPEQTGRMNRPIDYRTDFYSLGVTLYELLSGGVPFTTGDAMELVHCHLARKPLPLHERNPEVPVAVSDVVMRLMAKTADARYQSIAGLSADLATCIEALRETGDVEPFPLGRRDVTETFRVPQNLVGRERETALLMDALARVTTAHERSPRAEIVLVAGSSGIGKSFLVQELYRPITAERGYFIAGKFDQLKRSTPYTAIVAAFRSLVRQLLTESEAELDRWRSELAAALGPNGQLLIDVIPEVALIIGPQPPVPAIGPTESQNRFNHVFSAFLRVFATRSHPLVVFLDDLQWADSASLKLIELLVGDDAPQCLLVLGAYRDSEVGAEHPFAMTLEALRSAGAPMTSMTLAPLSADQVTQLCADAVLTSREEAAPLARLVQQKTEGNPLFIGELLKALHQDGLLVFDRARGVFGWDIRSIEAKGLTDNVVELMVGKLRRLPEATQQALQLAACVGNSFELRTLAIVREESLGAAFEALLPAVAEGFVLTTSGLEIAEQTGESAPLVIQHFKFVHDRVQQAAYGLMSEDEREKAHLRIGRLLLASTSAEGRAERIFDLVYQLDRARSLIDDPNERAELARLNLAAGKKAKAATAYAAARDYLTMGMSLLSETPWEDDYELTLSLHKELADASALTSDYARSEALIRTTLVHAKDPVEKATVYNLLVTQYTMQAKYDEAIGAAKSGLAELGIDLALGDIPAAMEAELAVVKKKLEGVELSSLLTAEPMTDPVGRAAAGLLLNVLATAFYVSPLLYSLIIFKAVGMSLDYGPPPDSSDLYSYYGHLLSGIFGEHQAGYDFGRLSIDLSERFKSPDDTCKASFIFGNFVLPWTRHLREARAVNDAGYRAGLDSGELQFAGYILIYKLFNRLYEGRPLAEITADLPGFLSFNDKAQNQIATDIIEGLERAVANLTGATSSAEDFSGPRGTEAAYLEACQAHKSVMALCYYQILKTQVFVLYGLPEEALAASAAAEAMLPAILGNVAVAEHGFYTCLALAALARDEAGQKAHGARLDETLAKLEGWAASCPENFAHMHALASAEAARGRDDAAAMGLYDKAQRLARRHGFAQDAALASELSAAFWLSRGNKTVADALLREAYFGYRRWGATRKAEAMQKAHPSVLSGAGEQPSLLEGTARGTDRRTSSMLDLASVLKASQAISSEIVFSKLLTKLMDVVVENAGAERGALILEDRGDLIVQVEASAASRGGEGDAKPQEGPRPVAGSSRLSEEIVRYVFRTREDVILVDATREGHFTRSRYVEESKPRSVLCTALVHQGQVIGALYLENNLAAGAFTPERFELLRLLSSQIAISIENARLYSEMEVRVAKRTEELRAKNVDLEQAISHLTATQAQLIQSEKMASLGQLTAGIAHEIRNPLNLVTNFAQVSVDLVSELYEALAENPDLKVAEVREVVSDLQVNADKITEHGKRADEIVRSMMQHASGGSRSRQRTNVSALLNEYVNLAFYGAQTSPDEIEVTLRRDYSRDPVYANVVPQDIGRVFVNLLNNAFYAVRERRAREGEGFEPVVTVRTTLGPKFIEIRVEDSGAGVPLEVRDRIFEPFFTTKPTGSGTGLGLSMSYDIIVHGHGGTLATGEAVGGGAAFVITLPTE